MKTGSNRTIALTIVGLLLMAGAASTALAQGSSAPQTLDMREDQSSWINDPHVHQFYQATIDAFAQGADHLDRAAYEKRSREIFRAMAVSRHMPPEALENHLARIPGEMILIVTRDPQTLASYESFVTQLFGPQKQPVGASAPAR